MTSKYDITTIELSDVLIHGKNKYNSNNHDKKPDDYNKILNNTNTSLWIDNFHSNYIVINIDVTKLNWLYEANNIAKITGKFPNTLIDELEDFLSKNNNLNYIFTGKKYFVRTESVSLKYGQHGAGPYINLKQIMESLVSCKQHHCPLDKKIPIIKLYLLEWKENLNTDLEFRMFVNNNKITAISQQNIYSKNNILSKLQYNEIIDYLDKLIEYYENVIKRKITHIQEYTIDIAIIENKPYFIEINCFGKEYAAGSSLFHWLIDENILYGKNSDKIYFRYIIE